MNPSWEFLKCSPQLTTKWCRFFFTRQAHGLEKGRTKWPLKVLVDGGFQIFLIFIPTWGNDSIWLIFFKWVETTNWIGDTLLGSTRSISWFFTWKSRGFVMLGVDSLVVDTERPAWCIDAGNDFKKEGGHSSHAYFGRSEKATSRPYSGVL